MLVKDMCRLASIGASKLKRSLISNWSNGLVISVNKTKQKKQTKTEQFVA